MQRRQAFVEYMAIPEIAMFNEEAAIFNAFVEYGKFWACLFVEFGEQTTEYTIFNE